jgi:hypothetical protein
MSSRISGRPDISVSYASLIFVDGTRPLPPPRTISKAAPESGTSPTPEIVGAGEPAVEPPLITDATDARRE